MLQMLIGLQTELVELLRYRVDDVLNHITKVSIRNARRMEIENEILNSVKLKVRSI